MPTLTNLSPKMAVGVPLRVAVAYALVVFAGTLLVDILFREIVLPYLFPTLHAGDGFMVGGDSMGFHHKALEMASRIREHGWGEWQLRPFATLETPAGVAAALYAAFAPSTYVLLTFNAAVHAGAALCLLFILRPLVGGTIRHAVIATLPFVAFPTALYWHSQLLKDGMFILGIYLFLLGWLLSFRDAPISWRRQILAGGLLVCGTAIVWATRQYMLIVLAACGLVLTLLCGVLEHAWHRAGRLASAGVASRIVWRIAFCGALVLVGGPGRTSPGEYHLALYGHQAAASAPAAAASAPAAAASACPAWEVSVSVPIAIDRLAYSVAVARQGYLVGAVYAGAGSTIDRDRCLHSILELIGYLPRAMQIALFAPFPWQWIESATQGGGKAMRLIAGVEMLFAYVALVFAAVAIWQRRTMPWLWPALVFSVLLLLLFAYVTPNIGALHRMRYGFFMILVGLGAGFLARTLSERHAKRTTLEPPG